MKFISTRGGEVVSSASEAIAKGLASDGGLFVPQSFPCVKNELEKILDMDYAETATFVLSKFLEEYDYDALLNACKKAYAKFEDNDPVPVVKIDENLFLMELFHGPTLAFKDIALTILPYLLREGCDRSGVKETVLILVATSGDTGKAALEGFKDQPGIKIMVFYPSEGVSDMQKLQMATQEGSNVNVCAVKGNFDDCQSAVKTIFSGKEYAEKLKKSNVVLSSANSINFGRLAPQIAYYFSSYADIVNSGEIKLGDKIDFCVPTGNFGNILAGYYAKQMGLPIDKLVCASNQNNVLTDFFDTGIYNIDREFYKSASPSMDILISSNLERLIFELTGRNADLTAKRMVDMSKCKKYSITAEEQKVLLETFSAGYCDEDTCFDTIEEFMDEYGYPLDPHTAVAVNVADGFINDKPMIVLSTASPYKFPSTVYGAITGKTVDDAFKASLKLEAETAMPIPEQITKLKEKEVRFTKVIDRADISKAVFEFVNCENN